MALDELPLDDLETSPYYALVEQLMSYPFTFPAAGHRGRSDYVYMSDRTGEPALFYRDEAAGVDKQITPDGMAVMGPAALHPSHPMLASARDEGGNEDYAIYVIDLVSAEAQRITNGGVGRVNALYWADNASWVLVGNDADTVFVRHLDHDGTLRDVFTTDEHMLTAAYDPSRGLLAVSVGRGPGTRLALMDVLGDGAVRWVSETETSEDMHPALDGASGQLAYVTDLPGSHHQLVVRDVDTLGEVARADIPGEIDLLTGSLTWVDDGRLFASITRNAEISPRTFDLAAGTWSEPLAEVAAAGGIITRDGPLWSASSMARPPFVQALRGDEVVTLSELEVDGPYIDGESLWFESFDGRQVQGWLMRHPDPAAPLVVECHGGPTFFTGRWWSAYMQAIAMAGFSVFSVNFRGSTSFGTEFKNLNVGDAGGGDLQDVLWGGRFATAALGLATKPAIVGGSYGGFLTALALTTQPDDWAGGVAFVPIVDWVEDYERADAHYRRFVTHFMGGTPDELPDKYRARSPSANVATLRAPLLFVHGENDPRCPIAPVRAFVAQATSLGLPVELAATGGEGHGAVRRENRARDTVLCIEHLKRVFTAG